MKSGITPPLPKPVLYAEDEQDDGFFMRRAFGEVGISQPLVIVPDGEEAIDYLSGNGIYANRDEHPQPCLMLLDLNMPKKSGLEVLKWIRNEPSTSTLPVIVLTSSLQDEDIHRAYIQGANAYLVKPSAFEDLVSMVKTIQDFWLSQNRVWDKLCDNSGIE